MKVNVKSIVLLLITIGIVILGVSFMTERMQTKESEHYTDIIKLFDEDLVVSFVVEDDLTIKLEAYEKKALVDQNGQNLLDQNGNPVYETKPDGTPVYVTNDKGEPVLKTHTYTLSYSFQLQQINDIAYERFNSGASNLKYYDYQEPYQTPWYQTYLPFIIVIGISVIFWIFMMRQAPGGGKMNTFSKSKAKVSVNEKDAVKFADVAGADEEKAELEEVVEFLKDPTKFIKLGARIPRGVLLVGPPGTGKTLLAKAVAGEAGVPFFSISGSDFVEMYVGVGASRVRDLFDNARKTPASIIFIDEIDAVGRHRGAGLGGGHDEREQTLNQLLVEMDGFGTNSGVIVMAATNRPDILDPALLRPGRFDRRVTVNYPDMKGREEILRVHCRNKPLEETVNLKKIAQTTIGFTGAELANLMNEAALRAAKKNKALIGMEDIEESYMKLLLGPQKKHNMRREADNKLCAYHEAGHAVASYFCKHTDPIKHITIIPAGGAGGVTISVPTEDRMTASRKEMIDRIVLALGGRVAEEIILDDISTGASNDIQRATSIARNMVTRYGMSEKLGTVLYGSEHSDDAVFLGRDFSSGQNYSEKTAADIDDEIRNIISAAYELCKKHLTEHKDKLEFVAQFLLKNESMDEEQFKACMEMENPTIEEIENIASEKKRKSDEENKTAHENNAKAEAAEKARREEEARRIREEMEKSGRFPTDDFFENVFKVPGDEDNSDTDIPEKENIGEESEQKEKSAEEESKETDNTVKEEPSEKQKNDNE